MKKPDQQGDLFYAVRQAALRQPPPPPLPPAPPTVPPDEPQEPEPPGRPESRADQIEAGFTRFHKDNPRIWQLFIRFSFELINAGYNHYAVNAVFERIRWHVAIETRTDEPVKLNNNYRAYYARMFHIGFADHDGFFRLRKLISAAHPANVIDIAVFDSGPPESEGGLTERLRKLI